MKRYFILFSLLIIGLSSCLKTDVVADQKTIDDKKIQAYLKTNNLTYTKDVTGLYYKILIPGDLTATPTYPTSSSTVNLTYKYSYISGTEIGGNTAISSKLSAFIKGLQVGVPKIGSKGRISLIIPSALAYGNAEQNGITASSVLIYTVDLNGFAAN